jgi:ring-1,2-phenylacetyl-CoA epoxidase subunit PaaE
MTAKFHRLRVESVEPLTADAVRVVFAVPGPLRPEFRYSAGQHVTVRYEASDGSGQMRRSYSLCEAPPPAGLPPERLTIAVKRHGPGGFAEYAVSKLAPGDELDVLTPLGGFHAQPDAGHTGPDRIVAIAAGSGITPILAIVEDALRSSSDTSVALLYGNRTAADVMFVEDLADLKDRYGPRFEVLHVLSREDHGVPLLAGRIDREKLPRLLEAVGAGADEAYYLCGPFGMLEDARAVLAGLGAQHVRFELFDSGKGPKRAPTRAESEAAAKGAVIARIRVTLGGRTTRCEMRAADANLLEAVMRERPEVPYACTDGVCGTCRARLLEGTAVMARDYALEREEKIDGFVLTCQSLPTSDAVVLDFDA